jgi:hypothetical protein
MGFIVGIFCESLIIYKSFPISGLHLEDGAEHICEFVPEETSISGSQTEP